MNQDRAVWAKAELVWNGLLDIVYPPRCLVCGARCEEGALCRTCADGFAPVVPPFCDRCGSPVGVGQLACTVCKAAPEPPFAWSQTLGQYNGTLRQAIHRFKYDGKAALAQPLGRLLAQSLDKPVSPLLTATTGETLTFDAVVPVPLHPARFRQRGFNQAERIARVVAQERNWPLDAKGIFRTRRTHTQTRLSIVQRAANVQGAFACRQPMRYEGKAVLIVDDVLTTMATTKECARIARDAGATRVCIIALARG